MFGTSKSRKDGLQVYCIECRRDIDKESYGKPARKDALARSKQERQAKLRKFLRRVKAKGCSKCGEKEPCTIDFHHIKDKKFDIAFGVNRYGFSVIKDEMRKCVLVCANCHRKIHAGVLEL